MKNTRILLFASLLLVVAADNALAQSTIFNIPTTDTVAKSKVYFEFDFLPQIPAPDGADRIYTYNPRLVVGVPGNIEAGANFLTYQNSTGCNPVPATCGYFQPNIKWKFYSNDNAGLAAAGGTVWNTPINKRSGQDSWGLLYGEFSKKVKTGNYGPRFTAGPYGVVSANQDVSEGPVSFFGPRAGAILGYEQPVYSKVSFVADWFSGKNFYGYFTPGISITLPGNGLFNAGHSFGNDSWANDNATKNRFLFVYYGVTF
jgi:hypothetical protein